MLLQLVNPKFKNPTRKKTSKNKSKKGTSMAKKKAKKKVAKKKSTKRVTSKKATKKVASKKKATKKVAKKKTAKKVASRKKVAKKAAPKRTTKKAAKKKTAKKITSRKAGPDRRASVRKAAAKKAANTRKLKQKIEKVALEGDLLKEGIQTILDKPKKKRKAASKKRKPSTKRASKKRKSSSKSSKYGGARAVSKKKITKGTHKVNRRSRYHTMAKMKKGDTARFMYTSYGAKGRLVPSKKGKGKGRKYDNRLTVTRKNPIMGGNMKVKQYLKHDVSEAGGLVLGGFASEAINDLIVSKFPNLGVKMSNVFGRGTAAIAPLVLGVVGGVVADKTAKGKVKEHANMVSKGLIGAGVVTLGNTLYSMISNKGSAPKDSAPVGGFSVGQHSNYSPELNQATDFGGFITEDMSGFTYGDDNMGYADESADFGAMDESADFGSYWDSEESDY